MSSRLARIFAAGFVRVLIGVCVLVAAGSGVAAADAGDEPKRADAAANDDSGTTSRVLRVGPGQALSTVAQAARIARDGDTVEILAGTYRRDVATWSQNRLTLRAVAGRVLMDADGAAAEGKAIWVIKGDRVTVEGIDFTGARVDARNGAGIRHQGGSLTIRRCAFLDNDEGVLTSNNHASELRVENSEFGRNGAGDGQSHDLYVGEIRRLTVIGSYFHHARVGHLLKTRAALNEIMYNRLTDERGGSASYELEFPAGGVAYVIGNVIEQGPQTENPVIVSYGEEGYRSVRNALYLIHNTIVDDRSPEGVFLRVAADGARIVAINNLLVGHGELDGGRPGTYLNNVVARSDDIVSRATYDYRLRAESPLLGKAIDVPDADGITLHPDREYVHPMQTRPLGDTRLSPGALQTPAP